MNMIPRRAITDRAVVLLRWRLPTCASTLKPAGAARPNTGGASRSPLHPSTTGRGAPTRQPSTLPIDHPMSSLASALPSPLLRQESFVDPEGPSAAMAAAAAAAAAALLSLAPGGSGSSSGGRARLGRARSYSLEQGIAVLHSRASITHKQTPTPSDSYSYSLRLPAGLGAAALPGLDRHAGEDPTGHSSAGSDSGADGGAAETASEPLPRAPLRGRNGPLAAGADGAHAAGSDREQGQVLSNWAGAGLSCSQASSGYSTPVSCASYTYGSMVVPLGAPGSALHPAPSGSGGSGSASTTAAAAGAAGVWSLFSLKVDGRVPSRTAGTGASRTMSNLNPDSRQGSRTHMQRHGLLSNPPTATGLSDATKAMPHRGDASPVPATEGAAAGGAGGAAAGAQAPPPALQHGRSWHAAAQRAAGSALLQSWGSFDFSPAAGAPAEAAHGGSTTGTDVHAWQPIPVLPGRNGPAPGKPPLAVPIATRAHMPSTSSVFRPRGASLPHSMAQRVPSTSATTSSGTGPGPDAASAAGASGSDGEDADGGFALATIDLPLPPSSEHPQLDADAGAEAAGANAAGELLAPNALQSEPAGKGNGNCSGNQPAAAPSTSEPRGSTGGQAAWTGAHRSSHHVPPSQSHVGPSRPPVARGNSERVMGVANRGRTIGPPPPSLLGTGSFAASLAGSMGGTGTGAGTGGQVHLVEEATALASRPLSASLGRDRLQKLLLMQHMQQAGGGAAFLGGVHGQGQGHAGAALPSVQVLSATLSTSATGGQSVQKSPPPQPQPQPQAYGSWRGRRGLAPPALALTANNSLFMTHDSLTGAAADAGSPGGRHPIRSYTQYADGRSPGNGPAAGATTQPLVAPSAPVSAAPSRKVGSEWLASAGASAAGSGRSVGGRGAARGGVRRDPSMLALLTRLASGTGGNGLPQQSQGQEQQGQQQHSQGPAHGQGHGQAVPTSNPLEAVGLDEVTMTPVALKKRANSHPVVVYLCRWAGQAGGSGGRGRWAGQVGGAWRRGMGGAWGLTRVPIGLRVLSIFH